LEISSSIAFISSSIAIGPYSYKQGKKDLGNKDLFDINVRIIAISWKKNKGNNKNAG
jgi:hypothetical protein